MAVQITGGGQSSTTYYSTSDVGGSDADVTGSASYEVPNSPGVTVNRGTSVGKLIDDTLQSHGLAATAVTFAEVDGPDNYQRHLLTMSELQPADGSSLKPVMYANGASEMSFIRPMRSADDDQRAQGPDQGFFSSSEGGSLLVQVHLSGTKLNPSVSAVSTDANSRTFVLSCSGCAGVQSAWFFPDGTMSSEASPSFTFPPDYDAGSYQFAVSVNDPTDGSFGWGATYVRVGVAPTPSPSASQTGSGGNGGGHHGSNHGSNGHSANPHPSGGHGGSATAAPSATAAATDSNQPTLTPSLPTSSLSIPATDGPLTSPSRPARVPTPTIAPTPSLSTDGRASVTGVLLANAGAAAPSDGTVVSDVPPATSAAAPRLEPGYAIDPLVWLGIGGLLLLGAGAASENDRIHRAVVTRLRRWARIGA